MMECAEQERPSRPTRPTPPARPPPPQSSSTAQRSGSASTQSSTTTSFRDFQKLHDKAFAAVQKGLNADEEGDDSAALRHYTSSLALLEEVLCTDCENLPGATAPERDSAKQMQQKMNKTKLQISYRVESLRGGDQQSGLMETGVDSEYSGVRLPSYDEAVSSPNNSLLSEAALGDSIMAAEYPAFGTRQRVSTQATVLFSIMEGAQIFFITMEGNVSAPSYPTSLHVVKFEDAAESSSDGPPAFLQVGDWFYPLIPGASPVLHATNGAYLFPDLSPERTGSSVGLMLPDTVSSDDKHTLEDILKNFSLVHEQQASMQPQESPVQPSAPLEEAGEEATAPKTVAESGAEEVSTSSKISQGITVASKWISWGVEKGAEKAGNLIAYGSNKLREKLNPEDQPKPVDERVQTGMMYARKATHVGVKVSSYIVTKLGQATMALGREIAPHIRRKGEQLLPKSMKSSDKNKSAMDGVVQVAASGLQGFGTVYMGLESAAKALARSLANETVATVQHKYGDDAGRLAENTVYAAGNLALTAYNVDNLGVKAIAKRAAKDTGKAVLEDMHNEKKPPGPSGAGAGYDGSGGSKDKTGKPPGPSSSGKPGPSR